MFTQSVSIVSAFLYGLASFLSPCVLPLVPAYMGMLAGETAASAQRAKLVRAGLLFVLGFTLVFLAMGATASALGQWLTRYKNVLRIASGVLIIIMGLFSLDIVKIPALMRDRHLNMDRLRGAGAFAPLLIGVGFSFGWTPCVGPVLASVLLMAANTRTIWQGIFLLFVYAMGMGLPFLLIAFLAKVLLPHMKKLNRYLPIMQKVAGALMIAMGVLMLTGWLDRLSALSFF